MTNTPDEKDKTDSAATPDGKSAEQPTTKTPSGPSLTPIEQLMLSVMGENGAEIAQYIPEPELEPALKPVLKEPESTPKVAATEPDKNPEGVKTPPIVNKVLIDSLNKKEQKADQKAARSKGKKKSGNRVRLEDLIKLDEIMPSSGAHLLLKWCLCNLYKQSVFITRKFPKREKYGDGGMVNVILIDIRQAIKLAIEIEVFNPHTDREVKLRELDVILKQLIIEIEVAGILEYITPKRKTSWSLLVSQIDTLTVKMAMGEQHRKNQERIKIKKTEEKKEKLKSEARQKRAVEKAAKAAKEAKKQDEADQNQTTGRSDTRKSS